MNNHLSMLLISLETFLKSEVVNFISISANAFRLFIHHACPLEQSINNTSVKILGILTNWATEFVHALLVV